MSPKCLTFHFTVIAVNQSSQVVCSIIFANGLRTWKQKICSDTVLPNCLNIPGNEIDQTVRVHSQKCTDSAGLRSQTESIGSVRSSKPHNFGPITPRFLISSHSPCHLVWRLTSSFELGRLFRISQSSRRRASSLRAHTLSR